MAASLAEALSAGQTGPIDPQTSMWGGLATLGNPGDSPSLSKLLAQSLVDAYRSYKGTNPRLVPVDRVPSAVMSPEDQAAMSPETFANPMVGPMIGGIASIPQRAIEGSQEDVNHLGEPGYQMQAIAPAADAAMLMMGGAGVVPAEANALRAGLTGVRSYKAGDVSFLEGGAARPKGRPETHYATDAAGAETHAYDLHTVRDEAGNIHGVVSNIRPLDEYGKVTSSAAPPTRVQQYQLQKSIAGDVRGHLEDAAELDTEVARQRAMTPAERQAEDDAAAQAKLIADKEHTASVNGVVDAAVARGWRPEVNQYGGWQRPAEFQPFASPASEAKIAARLQEHGISLEKPKRTPKEGS